VPGKEKQDQVIKMHKREEIEIENIGIAKKPRGLSFRGRVRNIKLAEKENIDQGNKKCREVTKGLKEIAQSIEKTYWLKYKLDINYIKHSKNISYIKTKIQKGQKENTKEIREALVGANGVLNVMIKELIKTGFLSAKTTGTKEGINVKELTTFPYFWMHVLSKRMMALNLWKVFVNRMVTNKMKCYKLYVANTVIKNISGLTYLFIDRLKILATTGAERESKENTRAIPFSRVQGMKQSTIKNVTGINKVSSQKLNQKMDMQSNPGTTGLGYKYVVWAPRGTTGETKQGQTQIWIKQEGEQTAASMTIKQGDILYLSFQRALENVNQLGYINYISSAILKEVVWPKVNKETLKTGKSAKELMLKTEVGETKSITQKNNQQKEGVQKMQTGKTERSPDQKTKREIERSAPRIRIQKSQVGGANLTIQIDTQIPETLRSIDYHKELVITKYGRTGVLNERSEETRNMRLSLTNRVAPFKRMKQSVSLFVDNKGNRGETIKEEINPKWEIKKIELDRAEKEKETLYFLFSRAQINETQKPQKQKRNISIFESFFEKLNMSWKQSLFFSTKQSELKKIYQRKTSKALTGTTEASKYSLTPFVPYIYTPEIFNRNALFSPMITLRLSTGALAHSAERLAVPYIKTRIGQDQGTTAASLALSQLPLGYNTINSSGETIAKFRFFSLSQSDKSSVKISKFPYFFFEALTRQPRNTIYTQQHNTTKGHRFYVIQDAVNQKYDSKNTGFLPLPKHPQFGPTLANLPDAIERTWPFVKNGLTSTDKSLTSSFMRPLDIVIKYHHSKAHTAAAFTANISRFLIAFLKKNKGSKNKFQQLKNITFKLLRATGRDRFLGVGFRYSGRVYGAKKAASFKMLFGSVPFSTLDANVDYSSLTQKTRNGTWGFQTWLHGKQKKALKKNILLDTRIGNHRPATI
jgi:hypothetical protein